MISIKLFCSLIEITLRYRCSPVNLLHIFRKNFYKNTSAGLLLETFQAAVDSQEYLTGFEKFTYLKGQLDEHAASCVGGFSFRSRNYKEAMAFLRERFGNSQTNIRAFVKKIAKFTPKLNSKNSISKITSFYNTIRVDSSQYGPKMIPVILNQLPDLVNLIGTRKLGREFLSIKKFMECIRREVEAKKNVIWN